jgi:hypothetical protein
MRTIDNILANTTRRPEPEELANISESEIIEAVTRSPQSIGLQNESEARDSIQFMLNSVRLTTEAISLLPYMEEIVDTILKNYSDHTMLFAARDAEPLYDATKIVLYGDRRSDQVYLFPGSKHLMNNLVSHSPETQRQFLACYGINEETKNIILCDSGFKGTIGVLLREVLDNCYADSKEVEIGVVSVEPGDYPAKELIQFSIDEKEAANRFPLTFGYSNMPIDIQSYSDNYHIGVALQSLPKFHGSFLRLMRDRTLEICDFGVSRDLDKARGVDPDYCNPFAALIIQKRVIDYFSK